MLLKLFADVLYMLEFVYISLFIFFPFAHMHSIDVLVHISVYLCLYVAVNGLASQRCSAVTTKPAATHTLVP